MTIPNVASYPDLCGVCGCAVGNHVDPYESDDDAVLFATRKGDWDESINCCTDCDDCPFYAYRQWQREKRERRMA